MNNSITLLHISDPQFGKKHGFGSTDDLDGLYQRLEDDLIALADNHELRPQLVVVSGDLAEWGRPSEFQEGERFLRRLVDHLKLGQDRVVLIPGNHDISRSACEAYFKECEGNEESPQPPYWPKWKHYAQMFETFYQGKKDIAFTAEEPWSFFEIPELRLVVAGLNSTMAESHRPDDHYGHVGEAQLRWFADRLRPYRERGWLRIGAVHHNPIRNATDDDENLRDVDRLHHFLGQELNLLLHGHTHDSKLHWLGPDLPVVSTGSAALNRETRPEEVPNQYQMIGVFPDRLQRWTRRYVVSQGRWIADTSSSRSGDEWKTEEKVPFKDVHGTFALAPTPASSTISSPPSTSPTPAPIPGPVALQGPESQVPESRAVQLWREKLDFLREQEVSTEGASALFSLKKQIAEAEAKIEELRKKDRNR